MAPSNIVQSSSTLPPVAGGDEEFAPSVWGDFFVTYAPPVSQASEQRMRERAERLKAQVRQAFDAASMDVAGLVTYVDTLERLGIDNHFRDLIGGALDRIRAEELPEHGGGLHIVALRFHLLRQHGIWVSTDVFDAFRDDASGFCSSLCSDDDPRGLLSLYNAAHMAVPGEVVLDDAIAFARGRLLDILRGSKVRSPVSEQITRALDIPLPRFTRRLETMHYIAEYEHEETHDGLLLELARLNFVLVRALHLRELKDLSLWWRDLYNTVKLPYARDRMVEIYFWTCGMLHEEEYSLARMFFAKTFGMVSLMDDTFDVHATLDECHKLKEAMQR
ncbi:Alpha-humulene/(-)-(E)-beta-caryophyllene synthase [Zea mays]|uniref:Alpha-humulene/(-)-(E)-beta-caryophyllene synthase n=1 Tax=Zea mays TaxID=4577 RepID=A0A1D6EFQ6_MAIZE|nr:Alpha-humulene/(-)-(E)-beta-caryophyllene synthase [Zea mays]